MTVLPLVDPSAAPPRRFALFEAGFRVFFLLAPLYATFAVLEWILVYTGRIEIPVTVSPTLWHAHEMIFGFAAAGVTGFFLTAVPNWTGVPYVRGGPLIGLGVLWLAGRLAMNLPGLVPPPLAAAVDLAFLPVLAALVMPPLLRGGGGRNGVLLVVLAVLWSADLAMQAEFVGLAADTAARGARAGIDVLALLITVIGGRIVPAFTTSALKLRGISPLPRSFPFLDRLTITVMAAFLVVEAAMGAGKIVGLVALAAGLLQAARLYFWRGLATRRVPILWVLHLGYGWLVLGLLLKGAAALSDAIPETAALHALTAGAIGTMLLAVMSRAALGHTGRRIATHPAIVAAYVLISLAAVLRIAAPFAPALLGHLVACSAIAWSLGFALFAVIYAPMLVCPRIDGQPG